MRKFYALFNNVDALRQELSQSIEEIKSTVLSQLQAYDLSKYDDIVFVSKSLGTLVAGWIAEKICIEARHIYLTPIKETLHYIQNCKNIIIVVAGTKDKQLDADILKQHCIKENICLKQIDN